jgi:hypothetical protein
MVVIVENVRAASKSYLATAKHHSSVGSFLEPPRSKGLSRV